MATLSHYTSFEDLKNSKVSGNPIPADKMEADMKALVDLLIANLTHSNTTQQQSNSKEGGK